MAEEVVVEGAESGALDPVNTPDVTEVAPDGTDFIDFEQLDPKVKSRFDRIYRNMKESERALVESAKTQRVLVDRLTRLEKSDISSKGANAINSLNAMKIQALDEGDSAKVIEIDNKIRAVEQSQNYSPEPIAVPEVNSQGLSPQEESRMESWATEKDGDGNLKRPWADPGHPNHQKAATVGYAAMQDSTLGSLEEQLNEIDRMMGVTPPAERSSAGVLPAGEGGRRPTKKSSGLSPDEKSIARVMYPEAKNAAEAEGKYLKAKQGLSL